MTPAATQRRPDRDRFAAGGTNHMTDFDYGLAGRRTAWPVASPAEMFWPDILSPVSHLEGDREFADSALEGTGFEPSVPRKVPGRGVVSVPALLDFPPTENSARTVRRGLMSPGS
jgi:hypothetical protein